MILPAADEPLDLGVQCLNSDLELQRPGWEPRDHLAQRERQPVGDQLEVQEQPGRPPLEEELEDATAGADVEIEGAVDELEVARAAVEQALHRGEERRAWPPPPPLP